MGRALIIIDIQNDYFPGGILPLHQAEETEARIVEAIGRAQTASDRIILVQHISAAKTGLFAADGAGVAIRPAILAATGSVPVVVKHLADAFQQTDLAKHLEGVEELLVCGMMTQNCVAFSAMSRDADSYRVSVVGDLCAAPSEIVHEIALNALGSKRTLYSAAELWP